MLCEPQPKSFHWKSRGGRGLWHMPTCSHSGHNSQAEARSWELRPGLQHGRQGPKFLGRRPLLSQVHQQGAGPADSSSPVTRLSCSVLVPVTQRPFPWAALALWPVLAESQSKRHPAGPSHMELPLALGVRTLPRNHQQTHGLRRRMDPGAMQRPGSADPGSALLCPVVLGQRQPPLPIPSLGPIPTTVGQSPILLALLPPTAVTSGTLTKDRAAQGSSAGCQGGQPETRHRPPGLREPFRSRVSSRFWMFLQTKAT